MLLKMARLQIIGLRADLDATVAALQRLGVVHIEDATHSLALTSVALDEAHARLQEDLTYLAARIDALLRLLTPPADTPTPPWTPPGASRDLADRLAADLDTIAPPIQALAQRRDDLDAEAATLPRYAATLRKLTPLTLEIHELQGFDTAAVLVDRRRRAVLDFIQLELDRLAGGQGELIQQDVDEHTTAAVLVYPRALAGPVQALLGQENITQLRLPKEVAGRTFRDALAALNRRQADVQIELQRIDADLAEQGRQWAPSLVAWRREVANRLLALAAQGRFAATDYTFVVEGWVPQRAVAMVRETLTREIGATVVVNELTVTHEDAAHVPVAFANPAPLRPFETLVTLMSVPSYGGIDPTPLVALFFPLFFGLIVGDIAYGLILLTLALWLTRRLARQPLLRDVACLWVYGALWAIVFGFLYGEFLGPLGHEMGLRPLWMSRDAENIASLFLFSLALGTTHVTLGLLLGAWQAWRERQRGELAAKVGMLIVLAALFGMVGVVSEILPATYFTPAVALLLVGMVLLIVPSAPLGLLLGPLEMLETVGNILSYLRLAAIGLAGVYLALVANEMAGAVGNVVIGVIIALLLHTLNFAINMLSPTIQSLRLQYVEFFRHFYQGGGREYRPFRLE